MIRMYQLLICKDGRAHIPFDFETYGSAVAAAEREWSKMTKEEQEACSGIEGCFELLVNGRVICTWTAGYGMREFRYEDMSTRHHYDREAAIGLLKRRFTPWLFRCKVSDEHPAIVLEDMGLAYSAGEVLWSHPDDFDKKYQEEILRRMDLIDNGYDSDGLRLAEEFWRSQRDEQ